MGALQVKLVETNVRKFSHFPENFVKDTDAWDKKTGVVVP